MIIDIILVSSIHVPFIPLAIPIILLHTQYGFSEDHSSAKMWQRSWLSRWSIELGNWPMCSAEWLINAARETRCGTQKPALVNDEK